MWDTLSPTGLLSFLTEPFSLPFMQRALLAALLVSVVSAVIGAFVVLKGLAFIGDALAHASFAGVAIAFVLGQNVYLGAGVAAILTALGIAFVSRRARVSFDTAIGILFVGAFSLGIVIISRQRSYTVDLFGFVFGNILGVGWDDLVLMSVVGLLVLAVIGSFYKEFLFTAYDPMMAAASGIPVALVQYGLLALLGLATVAALKAVGIVLVVAMLVTPPATATLLVRRLSHIIVLGAGFAIFSSLLGLYISYYAAVASGAAIVLVATMLFFLVLLLSPHRGILRRRSPSGRSDFAPGRPTAEH